jgi:hypothetical protein
LTYEFIEESADKREVTKLIAQLAKAMKSDFLVQKSNGLRKGRFSLSEFNRLVDRAYGLSNKQAITYGKSIGNKILNGVELNSTDSLVSPIDLQSICCFFLRNQGSLGWPEFRKAIRDSGPQFQGLLSISAMNAEDRVKEIKNSNMDFVIDSSQPLTKQLRELADSLEPLEAKIEQMRIHSMKLAEANANLANRNQSLEEALIRFRSAIARLEKGAAKETNTGKRRQMQQMIEAFKQKVSEIID